MYEYIQQPTQNSHTASNAAKTDRIPQTINDAVSKSIKYRIKAKATNPRPILAAKSFGGAKMNFGFTSNESRI